MRRPDHFREFYRAEIPTDQEHWHTNADRVVRLEAPSRRVFIRYVGDPAVNNVRIYAHCVEDAPRPPSPVRIRHAWREGGTLRTQTVTRRQPGLYTVTCNQEPQDESIELSVLSRQP